MSHSKRNTTRAVFTSYERNLARSAWGTNSAHLSRDSFLPFASCKLCLMPAQSPVSCLHGDIFCRECALSNILAQKQEIKRAEKAKETEDKDADEEKNRLDGEARERAVTEFEKIQMGLEAKTGSSRKVVGMSEGKAVVEEDVVGGKRGGKRKFELDEEELMRIAQEERSKARKAIDDENASRTTLPSFWVPSVATTANTTDVLHIIKKKIKASPICPASPIDKPHNYSLATLITLEFSEEKDATTGKSQRVCPSCKKALSNTSKATLAKPCGHVLCKSCVEKFMVPVVDAHAAKEDQGKIACFVCDADLTESKLNGGREGKEGKEKIKPGLVEIRSEGTGFASAGGNKVSKEGVNFKC